MTPFFGKKSLSFSITTNYQDLVHLSMYAHKKLCKVIYQTDDSGIPRERTCNFWFIEFPLSYCASIMNNYFSHNLRK